MLFLPVLYCAGAVSAGFTAAQVLFLPASLLRVSSRQALPASLLRVLSLQVLRVSFRQVLFRLRVSLQQKFPFLPPSQVSGSRSHF